MIDAFRIFLVFVALLLLFEVFCHIMIPALYTWQLVEVRVRARAVLVTRPSQLVYLWS